MTADAMKAVFTMPDEVLSTSEKGFWSFGITYKKECWHHQQKGALASSKKECRQSGLQGEVLLSTDILIIAPTFLVSTTA